LKIRSFIAIDIKLFPKLVEFINEIKKTEANLKIVELKNIHLTIKFLGDIDEEKIDKIGGTIKEVTKDIKPFEIKLKGCGVFPNLNYIKVIWAGLKNCEEIKKIVKMINEKLSEIGIKKDKREFSAHLTIARLKSARGKEEIIKILKKYKDIEFGKLRVESVKLMKSELTPKGPIYSVLKEIKM